MKQKDERKGMDRRTFTSLNAKPPYLTKQGPILYDRRTGRDRRQLASATLAESVASLAE